MDISETTRWLVQLTLAGLAILGAAWIYLDFAPRLKPEIEVIARDAAHQLVVVRLSIENTSRVMVHQVVNGCTFQSVPILMQRGADRSEFVPFTHQSLSQAQGVVPTWQWQEPQTILTSTKYWYPGDKISVDRVLAFPAENCALHVGLQVTGRVSRLVRTLLWFRRGVDKFGGTAKPDRKLAASMRRAARKQERWTTTAFVLPSEGP